MLGKTVTVHIRDVIHEPSYLTRHGQVVEWHPSHIVLKVKVLGVGERGYNYTAYPWHQILDVMWSGD